MTLFPHFQTSLFLGLCFVAAPLSAQTGLLIVAHGADSGWDARVKATTAMVQWDGPVRTAFLMGASSVTQSWDIATQDLVKAGAKSIIVVPLMVSTSGEHVTEIRFLAGEIRDLPASMKAMGHEHIATSKPLVPMQVTRALDDSPELGEILTTRWSTLPARDRQRPLMLVAHGPSADSMVTAWIEGIRRATQPLSQRMNAPVHIGLLRDDAPAVVRAAAVKGIRDSISTLAKGDSVTVMTVLISAGAINNMVVPADLAGLPIRYLGAALAPHPALARWIERTAHEAQSVTARKNQP